MTINFADRVKDSVSMVRLAEKYGFEMNRGGFINCPFHTEKTASLKIYPQGFKCFGCGAGGSVIDFTMMLFDLKFYAAVSKLNDDFGLLLPMRSALTLRQKDSLVRAERARREAQEAQKDRLRILDAQYWELLYYWEIFNRNCRSYKPRNTDEKLHPLYVEALHNIEYINYLIDTLEIRRKNSGQRISYDHTGVDKGTISIHH